MLYMRYKSLPNTNIQKGDLALEDIVLISYIVCSMALVVMLCSDWLIANGTDKSGDMPLSTVIG